MISAWVIAILALSQSAAFAAVDWKKVQAETEELLAGYVRIDTSNPPGDVTAAADYMERFLRREGIGVRRYVADAGTGRVNLVARLEGRGKGKPLLMLSHMDVVPVEPSRWLMPPFGATVKEGEMWGRGTLDMKGMGVMQAMSMALLKREGKRPERDLILLLSADEEVGGDLGAGWMVENHYADLDPAYVLDEGAAGSRGMYTDDDRIVFGVSVAEKKVLWLKVSARGDSGHGSMPGKRLAPQKLASVLARIPSLEPPPRETPIVADMRRRLGRLADNSVIRALGRTTVTVTSLKAGVGAPPKVNVVPGTAEATIDCRLLPEDSVAAMISAIGELCSDPDVTLEVVHMPAETEPQSHESPLFDAISETVSRFVPGAVTVPVLLAGGTDARFFRARGVKAYGFEPMLRSVEEEELIHADNERVRIEELHRGTRIYRETLARFLGVP